MESVPKRFLEVLSESVWLRLLLKLEHGSLMYKRYVSGPVRQRFEHHKSLGSQGRAGGGGGGRNEERNEGQQNIEAGENSVSAVPRRTGTGPVADG